MSKLKPCPFCGSTDIRYSLKITGRFDVRYHASMYCNKCHCYGARTLTESVNHNDYKGRSHIEQDETVRQKAVEMWNTRTQPDITKIERWRANYTLPKEGFFNVLCGALVYTKTLEEYNQFRRTIKAEAIKEFAKRLRNMFSELCEYTGGNIKYIIDNLVKEMTSK